MTGLPRIVPRRVAAAVLLLAGMAACSAESPQAGAPETVAEIALPVLDPARVESGRGLYGQFCAACHGFDLRGDSDWKTPNADGSYRPPPQDASGHTWHHSDGLLVEIVRNGSMFATSPMPAFGDQLTDDEVLRIIEYFKSTWGTEERRFQLQQSLAETNP